MAYTVASVNGSEGKFVWGNKKIRMADITLTGTYPTGGETLTATDFGMRQILDVIGRSTEAAGQTTMWNVHWDRANNKMKLFGLAAGATGLTEHGAIAYATASVAHIILIGK